MAMAEMEEEEKAEMEITEEELEITAEEMDTKEKLPKQMGAVPKGVIKPLSKTKSPKETSLGNNYILNHEYMKK